MKNRLLSLSVVLLTVAGVFSTGNASAQDNEVVQNAAAAFATNDWMTAEKNYKQLTSSNPDDPFFHSRLGYCYLQEGKADMAVTELKKAQGLYTDAQKGKVPAQITDLYLGSALRQSDKVDDALKVLNDLKPTVTNKDLAEQVDRAIESCNKTKELKNNPKDITVLNLGKFVNSDADDHTPVIAPDGKTLYFTSKRKVDGHSTGEDGLYDENIYSSVLDASTGTWSKPQMLSSSVNNESNVAVAGISPDGNEMYIYRDDKNGTILVSKKSGSSWGEPVELNSNINTDYRETSASLSKDGNKLYFASNRPGGFGGMDIYVSERVGGDWGPAINLGTAVNTGLDEEAPYIAADGTLYFSSKGIGGLGGYDVFKTTQNAGKWAEPENLGVPVNSSADDVFLFLNSDGKSYYTSGRKDVNSGRTDLFVMGPTSLMNIGETVLQGVVEHCQKPLPASTIKVADHSTGKSFEVQPNAEGNFELKVAKGHNITVSAIINGNTVFEELFDVAVNSPASKTYKTIKLDPGVTCPVEEEDLAMQKYGKDIQEADVVIKMRDINFAFNKADNINSNADLDKLADYLKENKKAKIQIAGYCDAMGTAKFNNALAKRRAQAAYSYLTKKGVKANQLKVVAFGEENPVTYNKVNGEFNEEAKQYNRRLEFTVLNQGDKKLFIVPDRVYIPKKYLNPDYQEEYTKAKGNPETDK